MPSPGPVYLTSPSPRPRAIGGVVGGTPVETLLLLDATEHFDLELLNTLPWGEIGREIDAEPRRRRKVREKVEELLARVRQETDDPVAAGSLLRSRVVAWYHRSPEDPDWSRTMPPRWGGIFSNSREAGGRSHPWLVERLRQSVRHDSPSNPLARVLGRHLGSAREVKVAERAPAQLWAAEVAQALLDDLASHPRATHGKLALVRLSELAGRRSPETVNEALTSLLSSPAQGPFVLLHPNRYPDCELVVVRPPARGTAGATLSYVLHVVPTRAVSPGATGGPGSVDPGSPLSLEDSAGAADGEDASLMDPDPWAGEARSSSEWKVLLTGLKKQRQHLLAPPKDFRQRPSYRSLQELVVEDADARRLFLSTKWRGRPTGLALLASLLSERSLAPEASTDYEYLDSELGDAERGDPDRHPEPPAWSFPCGKVVREGDFQRGYRYRLESPTSSAAEPPR